MVGEIVVELLDRKAVVIERGSAGEAGELERRQLVEGRGQRLRITTGVVERRNQAGKARIGDEQVMSVDVSRHRRLIRGEIHSGQVHERLLVKHGDVVGIIDDPTKGRQVRRDGGKCPVDRIIG